MKNNKTDINSLPADLILKLFSYFNPYDIGVLALVCKTWSQLALDNNLWKEKSRLHFQRRFKTLAEEPHVQWFEEFKEDHKGEYAGFPHEARLIFSLVKEGQVQALKARTTLIPFEYFELRNLCYLNLTDHALRTNNQELLDFLYQTIKTHYDNNQVSTNGHGSWELTLLHWAIYYKQPVKTIIDLIHQGYDPTLGEQKKYTPLNYALYTKNRDLTIELLKYDSPTMPVYDKSISPLESAIKYDNKELVEILIEHLKKKAQVVINDQVIQQIPVEINRENNEGKTALHVAIERGNAHIVEYLINNGADINHKDKSGKTPLHYAISQNNFQILNLLLKKTTIQVNAVNEANQTPLNFAIASKAKPKCIRRLLLVSGIDVNIADNNGDTPLHHAAKDINGHYTSLLYAHSQWSNINRQNNQGQTPLHIAIENNNSSLVKLFLDDPDIDLNICDAEGRTPLNLLISRAGSLRILQLLLTKSEKIDFEKTDNNHYTPLHYAAKLTEPRYVSLLMKKFAANVNISTHEEAESPWLLAAGNRHPSIFKLFLNIQPNVNAVAGIEQNTALIVAAREGDLAKVQLLLARNADVNQANANGMTPLHAAMGKKGTMSIIEMLVAAHANLYALDFESRTLLHSAVIAGSLEKVKYLLGMHVNTNQLDKLYYPALWYAAKNHHEKIFLALLGENRPSANFSSKGKYLIHRAADIEDIEALELLLKHGANVNLLDSHFNTALHIAVRKENFEMVKLLVEKYHADYDIVTVKNSTSPLKLAAKCKNNAIYNYLQTRCIEAAAIRLIQSHPSNFVQYFINTGIFQPQLRAIPPMLPPQAPAFLPVNHDSNCSPSVFIPEQSLVVPHTPPANNRTTSPLFFAPIQEPGLPTARSPRRAAQSPHRAPHSPGKQPLIASGSNTPALSPASSPSKKRTARSLFVDASQSSPSSSSSSSSSKGNQSSEKRQRI